jgi:transcription antitermination factor NusG
MKTNVYSSESEMESIVPVTTDREAHSKRWIAALVQSCLEKRVGERLDKLGVENYIPTQTVIRQWSDRKKKIERVVIPMIVFIRTDEMTERRLRMQTYIRKILSYPGQWKAAVIPDAQIDRLKFMLRHAESSVELLEQTLQVGEAIRVARGPLKGLEGEICQVQPDKPMVAIRIDCLGYACVSIDKSDLECI